MKDVLNVSVLFIAGFGPIVRDTRESRKLYGDVMGIGFKEETGAYLHTEAVPGAKTFALWPLSQPTHSCSRVPEVYAPNWRLSLHPVKCSTQLQVWS